MTCPANSTGTGGSAGITCAAAQGGASGRNNDYAMRYVDVDSDASTFDSSSAQVTIPTGANVLYAALIWGGITGAGKLYGVPGAGGPVAGSPAPDVALQGTVQLKAPGASGYTAEASTQTDNFTSTYGATYQGYRTVTSEVQAGGSGTYTVANVQVGTGGNVFGGWTLAVAYHDPAQPVRNLVVYTGFGTVAGAYDGAGATPNSPLTIPVTGFTTPASGPVITRLGAVVYDGDRGQTGDELTLGSTALSNRRNPVDDVFNSTISDLGTAVQGGNPSYDNTLGIDIDRFDATGALPNSATSATISLSTSKGTGETYYPGVLTFATDLNSSPLTGTKTVTDANGGRVLPGDTLTYNVSVKNNGNTDATGSVLTDAIPDGASYLAGSLKVANTAGTAPTARTDAVDTDQAEASAASGVTVRLGSDATGTAGGTIPAGVTSKVQFKVTIDSAVVDQQAIRNTALFTDEDTNTGTVFEGASNAARVTVIGPPMLTFTTVPPGARNSAYSDQLTSTGGSAPVGWSFTGTLPPGLSLDTTTGVLSGTPTTTGTYAFVVRILDIDNRTDTQSVTMQIYDTAGTISLSSSSTSVTFGTAPTLTATAGPGTTASGTVTFTDVPASGPQAGTTVTLGTATAVNGVASLAKTLPAFGPNLVTATYAGDATRSPATSAPVTVQVNGYAGEVIVTEFRTCGPAGVNDSYVELYNTGPTVPLAGILVTADSGASTSLLSDAGTFGTNRSYLLTGSSFSLGAIATSNASAVVGTGGMKVQVPDTAATQTDAVGPSSGSHLGAALPAMTGSPTDNYAWWRQESAGRPVNTGNNAIDFRLVSTAGAVVGGVQSTLGAPSPTGTADPYQHNSDLQSALLDAGASAAAVPNRVYAVGTPGQLTIQRKITNTSLKAVTSVKLRVTALSEANGAPEPGVATQPVTPATLRVVNPATSTSSVPVSAGPPVSVSNLSVDTPTSGTTGGGLNSTLSVPLPSGLAAGASINVSFTFAVDTPGYFWFGYDIDAIGGTVSAQSLLASPQFQLGTIPVPWPGVTPGRLRSGGVLGAVRHRAVSAVSAVSAVRAGTAAGAAGLL